MTIFGTKQPVSLAQTRCNSVDRFTAIPVGGKIVSQQIDKLDSVV